jgi:threonine dehydrogenase-like Zn-dependent dehydrogenase
VVAVGERVRSVEIGNRVAFLSDRAFAEYDVASASSLVPLPRTLDSADMPGEPLGCAINIWRRCAIEPGQTVAVIGIGFLGALLVQLAARAGARVLAISQRPCSLEVARRMGAEAAFELGEEDGPIVARIEELTGGVGCDRVIELVGLQRPLDLAGKLCRVRGRLVIGGFHQDGPRQVDMFLWNWRGLDVINAHERDPEVYVEGIRSAIHRVMLGRLDPKPLYTHRLELDRASEAFELLRERPAGFVKALVMP